MGWLFGDGRSSKCREAGDAMNLLREYIRTLLTEADIHGTRVDMYFGTGGDSDLYDELTSLRFPLTVYRGLRLKPGEEIDVRRLGGGGEGDHWSRSRRAAVDFAKGFSSSARKFGDPTLITGQIVSPGDVDWQSTVDLNREHPNEVEIVAFKVSNPQVHSIGEKIRYQEVREYIRESLRDVAEMPAVLYHATYGPLIDSIQQRGLGGQVEWRAWDFSEPGIVYLSPDHYDAHA